jgi:hypothetical protein
MGALVVACDALARCSSQLRTSQRHAEMAGLKTGPVYMRAHMVSLVCG